MDEVRCPICQGRYGVCRELPGQNGWRTFACDGCGKFAVTWEAFSDFFADGSALKSVERAALSHRVRTTPQALVPTQIDESWISGFLASPALPNPSIQAANLIRVVGDYVSSEGTPFPIDAETLTPLIGAFDLHATNLLIMELVEQNLLRKQGDVARPNTRGSGTIIGPQYTLSLEGWGRYEAEKRGQVSGNYGFIAMAFNKAALEDVMANVLKPGVLKGTGYQLIDLRDVQRAGIIDNLLREKIRDAAFVLADLTHENAGAYWEAGYAEGLGKPVIYLCEDAKFSTQKTHFDTNHCTTVTWSEADPAACLPSLVATIRRSISGS